MYQLSDHYDGTKFHNSDRSQGVRKRFLNALKWKLTSKKKPWVVVKENQHKPDLASKPQITFINHATFLLQFETRTVITDPVFSDRVGPFKWLGIKRSHPPALSIEELPAIDLIVISHNHYDHMDLPSILKIVERDNPTLIVPLGNRKLLEKKGVKNVIELDWWEEAHSVVLTPAQHWSGRGLLDVCDSLWGGFFFKEEKVLFAGDGGYNDHFKLMQERLGEIDLSLLPVGAYAPRWFMKPQHMDPDEAVMAHLDLQSKQSIGFHYGTFQLADEPKEEPAEKLRAALLQHALNEETFILLEPGQALQLK